MEEQGGILLWTSIDGLRNIKADKQSYAYSEKTEMNCLQVLVPFGAIHAFEKSRNPEEGLQFMLWEKRKW